MKAVRTTNIPPSASRRPPPLAYGLLLFLGAAAAPFLLSLDSTYSDRFLRRSLSDGSLYSLKDGAKYANLQDRSDIDASIEHRARNNDDPDKCSRMFLYLPDFFAEHGHGSQINTYIMGVTASTYLDRAMVLVEPPTEISKYAGGSQFGCPVDAFYETMTGKTTAAVTAEWHVKDDFPGGFSRLVDQPAWLSHGCPIPCGETFNYQRWVSIHQRYHGGEFPEITCENPDGSETNVVVAGGAKVRQWFREHETTMVRNLGGPIVETWGANLGATPHEAKLFAGLRSSSDIWDFVLGLMNKAGFLRLRPWIARDVELFLKSFDLPLDKEYSAIHVRRGDKLAEEARGEVIRYWRMQGHTDMENLPSDYVPFVAYLNQWDGPETCQKDANGELRIMKHNVYVATDDPIVVKEEIAALPDHIDPNTVLHNQCHQLTFYFNPTDEGAFHLNGDGERGFEDAEEGQQDSCFQRHQRNVASVADMMLLSKAKTFVGEYNSNWGRVIRTMRVRLDVPVVQSDDEGGDTGGDVAVVAGGDLVPGVDRLTKTLDTRIAWPRGML